MKSLAFVLALTIIQCVTSYPAPEKVGVIREGPGPVVIIEGPDGSVIKAQIGLGVIVPSVPGVIVPSVPGLIVPPVPGVILPSIPGLIPAPPKAPSEVELIEPKTETNETEGDDSSTEEVTESAEGGTNDVDVARVLQQEEELKEVQQAASEAASAQIEAQQEAQRNAEEQNQ